MCVLKIEYFLPKLEVLAKKMSLSILLRPRMRVSNIYESVQGIETSPWTMLVEDAAIYMFTTRGDNKEKNRLCRENLPALADIFLSQP